MTLTVTDPLKLPTRNNTRRNRAQQPRRLPLAHIIKLSGYTCYSDASAEAHKKQERGYWLTARALYEIDRMPTPHHLVCFFLIALATATLCAFGFDVAIVFGILVAALMAKQMQRARQKQLAQKVSELEKNPLYGWQTVSYEEYLLLTRALHLTPAPPEVHTQVAVITSRLKDTTAEIEYCGADPILRFRNKHECYSTFLWS